jgi:transcriptional regulator with XRE-family HTH domain
MKKDKSRLNISGPLVRKLRKSNDWTQKEFATHLREAGLKESTRRWVSKLESGEVTLRDVDLPYLRSVLGVSFSDAFAALISKTSELSPTTEKPSPPKLSHLTNLLPAFLLLAI